MSNFLTKLSGTKIEGRALTVRPVDDTTKIVSRLLDGSFHVQQVGAPAKTLTVSVVVKNKAVLDDICAICEPIIVNHYDKAYTGVISSQSITWAPVNVGDRRYRGVFEVVVLGVADR